MSKYASCLLAGACLLPVVARAQEAPVLPVQHLPPVDVVPYQAAPDDRTEDAAAASRRNIDSFVITRRDIASQAPRTNDTARMLENTPGVSLYGAGAISSLPVIHGLNDDRNAVLLGGVPITAACANHMNPPLSYVDPMAIGQIEVLTVNVPVSKGGDSIGGSVLVTPRLPIFATQPLAGGGAPALGPFGPGLIASGSVSTFFRSNGGGLGASGQVNMATEHFALVYDGAWSRSGNYYAGGNGSAVHSTLYQAQNHAATLSYNNEGQTLSARVAYQFIPYQGYPNQWMDMTGNNATTADLSYNGAFAWGALEANGYYHLTQHYMNFLADKNGGFDATPTSGMPMYVNNQDSGYRIKASIKTSDIDLVRVGNELRLQLLNENWSPVNSGMGMGMMCCSTFVNVSNGQRDVLGTYVEWERAWARDWSTLVGVRNDTVFMNAGEVQGYNTMMYGADAAAFNSLDHAKTDINFDATALIRFRPDDVSQFEFGYTRKTRSPNIYERYAWSTNPMAATMIGWFGDGNGYYGDINLVPEVAHTIALTAQWSDPAQKLWNVKVTPYYSYVQNYIDVDYRGQIAVMNNFGGMDTVNLLQFANHNAQLYGFDLSGQALIAQTVEYGDFLIRGVVGYVRGWRNDTGESLYHMMPLNGRVTLENKLPLFGALLTSALEVQAAAAKTLVETVRLEPTTPAYGIVNLRGSYEYQNLRLDFGIENIGNTLYYNPLGGIDIADWSVGTSSALHTPVAAMGRNFYGGVTIKF